MSEETLKYRLAAFTARRLTNTKAGYTYPPGGGRSAEWEQDTGHKLIVVSRGDGFDLYIGRDQMVNVPLTVDVAKKLTLWLLWWWMFTTVFGLTTRLWNWALGVMVRRHAK